MKWPACLLLLFACQGPAEVENDVVEDEFKYDTLAWGSAVLRYRDTSLAIHGIQGFLRDSVGDNLRSGSFGCGQDTLIDLNADGRLDYLREYYGEAGFGVKNRVYVALSNGPEGSFSECRQLNQLDNPVFLFDSGVVYGSYLGGGGGYGVKLKWKGNELDTLISIDIEVDQHGKDWVFNFSEKDHVTGSTRNRISHQAVYPAAYRHCDYEPVIREGFKPDRERQQAPSRDS